MIESFYLVIFLVLFCLIGFAFYRWSAKVNKTKSVLQFTGIVMIWLVYLYLISHSGFIYDKSMPPRFPLLIFVPIVIGMIVYFRSKSFATFSLALPFVFPILFQVFRVFMELIIHQTYVEGIIPVEPTFMGYNFEFYFALTAPLVTYFGVIKNVLPKKFLIGWNVAGILFLFIVVSIMISCYFIPEIWGYDEVVIDIIFTQLPLVLLPAFMVPMAVFFHIFSIKQLQKKR